MWFGLTQRTVDHRELIHLLKFVSVLHEGIYCSFLCWPAEGMRSPVSESSSLQPECFCFVCIFAAWQHFLNETDENAQRLLLCVHHTHTHIKNIFLGKEGEAKDAERSHPVYQEAGFQSLLLYLQECVAYTPLWHKQAFVFSKSELCMAELNPSVAHTPAYATP